MNRYDTEYCPVAEACMVCDGTELLKVEPFDFENATWAICLTRCEGCREKGEVRSFNIVDAVALSNAHVGHVERGARC